jgi:predicted aspartyl protease
MKFDKILAARVAAKWNSWPADKLAECAKNDEIYRVCVGTCMFALDKEDKKIPIQRLLDTGFAKYLTIVVPLTSMSMKMASFLRALEYARLPNENGGFEIEVISDVGKGKTSGEIFYGLALFESTSQMLSKIDEVIKSDSEKIKFKVQRYIDNGNISRLQDAYIKYALGQIIRLNKARETLAMN